MKPEKKSKANNNNTNSMDRVRGLVRYSVSHAGSNASEAYRRFVDARSLVTVTPGNARVAPFFSLYRHRHCHCRVIHLLGKLNLAPNQSLLVGLK